MWRIRFSNDDKGAVMFSTEDPVEVIEYVTKFFRQYKHVELSKEGEVEGENFL